jgi:regulatory protein
MILKAKGRRRRERKSLKDPNALPAALRLLARREHSEAELAERLGRKGFADASIAAAINRCRDLGYVDDARFALERARSLMRNGRAVGHRILADLKARGVSEADALAALEQAGREFEEEALLADLHRRRFPDFSYASADDRQRRRVVNFFLRRGFPLPRVLSFLKEER